MAAAGALPGTGQAAGGAGSATTKDETDKMTADPDNVRDEGQRARAGVGGRSGTEHDDLAITLADLARSLQEEKDTSTVLERIVPGRHRSCSWL